MQSKRLSRFSAQSASWFHAALLMGCGLLLPLLTGCGSGAPLVPANQPSQPGAPGAGLGGIDLDKLAPRQAIAPVPEADSSAGRQLPALDALGQPLRQLSSTGYGFQPLVPEDAISFTQAAPNPDGSLTLTPSATDPALAVFGLSGFRSGAYPVSAKLSFTGETADYFVAFPDYSSGRWRLEGPFNGAAEVGIVLRGQPAGYMDFISGGGSGYFAVIFAAGSAGGQLSGVEFGVNGGNQAPAPPRLNSEQPGELGVVLRWLSSKDESDADFSGYIVERAPQLGGEFQPLTVQPTPWHDYFDDSTVLGQTYRYRVFAVDTSGNRSSPDSTVIGPQAGAELNPVPRIRFSPEGPYTAPAQISYDMSESYDPQGEALFDFRVHSVINYADVYGTAETGSFELQPGSVLLELQVAAGTRTGYAMEWLTAYPQWAASSTLVRASDQTNAALPRLMGAAPFMLPGDSRPWLAGADYSANAVVFVRESAGALELHRVGLSSFPGRVSRPVVSGGQAYLTADAINGFQYLLSFTGSDAGVVKLIQVSQYYNISTVTTSEQNGVVQAFYIYSDNGVDWKLVSVSSDSNDSDEIVSSGAGMTSPLTAVYCQSDDKYDVFLVNSSGQTGWVRWDKATNTIVDSMVFNATAADYITAALDPATGQPAAAYRIVDTWYYRSFDGMAWSAEETASAVPCSSPGQLAFQDGSAFLFIAEDTGQTVLRERTGPAMWTDRNRPAGLVNGGVSCGLIAGEGPGELLGVDSAFTGGSVPTILNSLEPGDTDSELMLLPGINLPNFDFDAAGAADGLHVLLRPNLFASLEHLSSPDGSSWTGGGFPHLLQNIQLGATQDGALYAAGQRFGTSTAELYWWDSGAANWVDEMAALDVTNEGSVSLAASPLNTEVTLYAYDGGISAIRRYSGNHTGGYAASSTMTADPYWRGASVPGHYYGIAGGMDESQGSLTLPWSASSADFVVYEPFLEPQLQQMGQLFVNKFSHDAAVYLTRSSNPLLGIDQRIVFGSTYGQFLEAGRVEFSVFGNPQYSEVLFGPASFSDFVYGDARRTLSMATTRSANAVSLLAALDEREVRFEWTGEYGWEPLPLPQIERMMYPKLFIGHDGRWHILYYDYLEDALYLRSTL